MSAIRETQFQLPGQTDFYRGKVRDVYHISDEYLVIIASDRISAFDRVLPKPIPYKGQVLNQLAAHFLKATEDIVPNWVLDFPDPRVAIGHKCEPFKVEMVIRGYLAGHAWREYREGKRTISGVPMPTGLKESAPFPTPIITPATKAETGHDEDISRKEIIAQGLAEEADYRQLEDFTKKLFIRGSKMADECGLILVDTKYEFGKKDGQIYLIDEIHTPDSSRYYFKDGYEQRQREGLRQQQLSKEFVREWLMEHGFQGREGEQMPDMPDAFVHKVSQRYIELYEKNTGQRFEPADSTKEQLESCIIKALQELP